MKSLDALFQSIDDMANDGQDGISQADLLYYCPCPVKLAVKEQIDSICAATEGQTLKSFIPMGCTSVDPYDPLHRETDAAKLPSIIASIGFGDFFRKGFVEQFVNPGLFEAVLPEHIHPMYEQAGILDPDGHYVVYGVTPYIFLVDENRLGDLPLPTRWEHLLDPRYEGQINMCGDGDDMADAVLINFHAEFGMDGIKQFASNTCKLMHSSSMAKSGGTAKAGALSIIPYFFAESTKQPAHMKTIWPEDGASASPLYFLAKKEEQERVSRLTDFFINGFSTIESARWFLPLGGPMPESLPAHATIKWIGWDTIKNSDITTTRDMLNDAFRQMVGGLL